MRPIKATKRIALLGAAAAAVLAVTARADEGFRHISDAIRGAPSEANYFIGTPKGWKQPMTPWGQPDIQAKLDMMQASRVPLERCANAYGQAARQDRFDSLPCDMNKKWLTEEEYQAEVAKWRKQGDRAAELTKEGKLGEALRAGVTDPRIPQRETNLLVDPTDGLLPALTPEGKRLAYTMHSDWALPGEDIVFDGPTDFDSWDRCITRGMPSSMMPYRYNGGFFIMQSPGHVIFRLEMIHEARIIPTDGRAVPGSAIQEWMGISRGRWEGDTLVVVTDHYQPGPPMINLAVVGSPAGNRFPVSDKMKTTERITRLNDDWYLYEITTEDPQILTKPFTVRYPMKNDPSYEMPEYACHEGNTIVQNYVTTNRYERAHPTPEPPQPPVKVAPAVAETLAGTWEGTPRIVTIGVHIQLHFTKNADGTVNGKLIGTNLGKIDKPLRQFKIDGQVMRFQFPNIQPWNFAGKINSDGTITGYITSIQGGMPVTFKRVSSKT